MNHIIDISGQKFNSLTAIKPVRKYKSGNTIWLCECDCGNFCEVEGSILRRGKQISCGCYPSERMKKMNTKHNGFGTRLYEIWRQMHRRCYGKNTKAYKHYGGRGITICKEWHEYEMFRDWAMQNGYSESLTIDRIDVNDNYCPENCRWATAKEQANNKRNNRRVRFEDEIHTVSEWADIFGVKQTHLWGALSRNGWDIEELKERGWFNEQRKIS